MASLTSASHYVTSATRFQSRSSMYIDPRSDSTELVEAVPIDDMVNVSIDPAKSGLDFQNIAKKKRCLPLRKVKSLPFYSVQCILTKTM